MSKPTDKKAMVSGHICLDITPKFPETVGAKLSEVLVPGKLINIAEAKIGTGGPVSNTGLAMKKLGVDVLLNSKIGDDEFGSIIKNLVGEAAAFTTVPGQCSSYSVVLAPPGIDRMFLHNPGTNDTFTSEDVNYDALKDCSLFHLGYPPLMAKLYENEGAELVKIYKRVKEMGVTSSLDMAMIDPNSAAGKADWHAILEKTLPYVDIFVPSVEEIAFMIDRELFEKRNAEAGSDEAVLYYKPSDYPALSGKLLDMGAGIVTLKSGIKGFYMRTGSAERIGRTGPGGPEDHKLWAERELWAPSFVAKKFGAATGAGDATISGFLTAILAGFGPEKALSAANMVGWENVREVDTLSGVEDWGKTLELLADKSMEINKLDIEGDGWKFDSAARVYKGPND